MRIIVDYRPALRARTGVGEYTRNLVKAYRAAHSDELVLFTSSWKDRPAPSLRLELDSRVVDRRIPVSVLNFLWHHAEWPPIERIADSAEVVHAAHPLLIPARRAAQVVTIHDLFFLDHPELTRAEVRRDYPRLAPAHAQRADAVVTSSVRTQQMITERLRVPAERVYCCRPGAPTWARLGRAPNVPTSGYVLWLGTLESRKNVGTLLDAFETLARQSARGRTPQLVLAGGTTAESSEWLARIQTPPLSECVKHVGYVTDERREELFAGARALVLPSLDEGFGLTALEAMSAGVPVLASNRGSLPEVVESGGLLLDPTDTKAWEAAIDRVIRDDDWATSLGCAGLDRARTFTWQRAAEQLALAYRDAVERRGRR